MIKAKTAANKAKNGGKTAKTLPLMPELRLIWRNRMGVQPEIVSVFAANYAEMSRLRAGSPANAQPIRHLRHKIGSYTGTIQSAVKRHKPADPPASECGKARCSPGTNTA
jgi:hypothetical protein